MIFSGVEQSDGVNRARNRIRKMNDDDLLKWLEIAIQGMMRHLDNYQRTGDFAHLAEVSIAEMTVNLVVSDLMDRGVSSEEDKLKSQPRFGPGGEK